MPTLIQDLERIEQGLAAIRDEWSDPKFSQALQRGKSAVEAAAKAFCGSWIGYHSRVYFADLQPPPPGHHFSVEWGLSDSGPGWHEYSDDQLYDFLRSQVGSPTLDQLVESITQITEQMKDLREELLSILDACLARGDDPYLAKMKEQVEAARLHPARDYLARYQPKGQFMTRDSAALTQGILTPPHIRLLAQLDAVTSGFNLPKLLASFAKRTASHLSKKERARGFSPKQGNRVFIGHGGSAAWRELKDFIQDRLHLEADEFNRKAVAGITNITRLSEMLDDAAIAFLVMTAEDELKDGRMHARMNVIHEAGLFQGRLGFTRAIVLLEDGCEEFSNIQGLGQIRFPPKKIKAAFDEVRQVLEREGLLDSGSDS
jgi:predicted nucleotide-binding protein